MQTDVVVNFFISGNFSFSFVSTSLVYITLPKKKTKQREREITWEKLTTTRIFEGSVTLLAHLLRLRYPFSSPEPVVSVLVTWSWNEGLWKQPLPNVIKFLTSGHACAEVTNITAHAHNGFLSHTALLGKKCYFLSSLPRVASLGCFENKDFTQLGFTGFTDNLESKEEDINKNQLNTLLGRRTETINRQIIVWV